MKRTIGGSIIVIGQLLKFLGVDLNIGDQDIDIITNAVGGIIFGIGVVHSFVKNVKKTK
jgi:hypothetical protein